MTFRRAAASLAVTLLLLFSGACRKGEDGLSDGSSDPARESRYAEAVAGLCAAIDLAPTDLEASRSAFWDRAHNPLHEIAGELQQDDREAAAVLFEAKNRVERDFAEDSEDVRESLEVLEEKTRSSLAKIGISAPPC